MAKYLRCHTSGYGATEGSRYEVISEDYGAYVITDDAGYTHSWTKKKYSKWFTLETESTAGITLLPPDGVTLLPDESLGGLLREYNEVKRKARVGELVKATTDDNGFSFSGYSIGDVFVVTEICGGGGEDFGAGFMDNTGKERAFWTTEKYVVLEPSDIIRIDDTDRVNRGYRMVERKAAVGERVVVTNPEHDASDFGGYKIGDTATVLEYSTDSFGVYAITDMQRGGRALLRVAEYRVLEPLTDAIPTQLSSLDPVDQYVANVATLTSNISKLTTKVQVLEERVATLESAEKAKTIGIGGICGSMDVLAKLGVNKTPQQIRDEIVARAKADVERLLSTNHRTSCGRLGVWFTNTDGSFITDECNFVVNRDKRTVVAIISEIIPARIIGRGTAKAAPGEVFNIWIGKAIALYRALGLVVPAEYMSVPAPTEVRVGDIVRAGGDVNYLVVPKLSPGLTLNIGFLQRNPGDWFITDDSREESEGVNA